MHAAGRGGGAQPAAPALCFPLKKEKKKATSQPAAPSGEPDLAQRRLQLPGFASPGGRAGGECTSSPSPGPHGAARGASPRPSRAPQPRLLPLFPCPHSAPGPSARQRLAAPRLRLLQPRGSRGTSAGGARRCIGPFVVGAASPQPQPRHSWLAAAAGTSGCDPARTSTFWERGQGTPAGASKGRGLPSQVWGGGGGKETRLSSSNQPICTRRRGGEGKGKERTPPHTLSNRDKRHPPGHWIWRERPIRPLPTSGRSRLLSLPWSPGFPCLRDGQAKSPAREKKANQKTGGEKKAKREREQLGEAPRHPAALSDQRRPPSSRGRKSKALAPKRRGGKSRAANAKAQCVGRGSRAPSGERSAPGSKQVPAGLSSSAHPNGEKPPRPLISVQSRGAWRAFKCPPNGRCRLLSPPHKGKGLVPPCKGLGGHVGVRGAR